MSETYRKLIRADNATDAASRLLIEAASVYVDPKERPNLVGKAVDILQNALRNAEGYLADVAAEEEAAHVRQEIAA